MSVSAAPNREEAALLLAVGPGTVQAAPGVGLCKRTMLGCTKNREVAASVSGFHTWLCKRFGGVFARYATRAASGLGRLRESEDERVAPRAACSILGLITTNPEAVEFEERLAAIERQLCVTRADL